MSTVAGEAHYYSLFGLRVRSEIALPELFEDRFVDAPDVIIERGTIAEAKDAPAGLSSVGGSLILVVEEVGQYRISGGHRITVDPCPGVPERNVRLFLLGSAFGALLHQRGLLPLHANAVEIDGKAVAFMGASGAGKSTLAAWFHDQGYRVLADDVCVILFGDTGEAIACPGLPRFRLWLDTIELTGRQPAGLNRSYVGALEQLDKFDVPVDAASMIHANLPVAAIYRLAEGAEFAIAALAGVEAARAIFENTYRGEYIEAASAHRNHWQSAIALTRSTPVFEVVRTMDRGRFDAECGAVLDHARAICGSASG